MGRSGVSAICRATAAGRADAERDAAAGEAEPDKAGEAEASRAVSETVGAGDRETSPLTAASTPFADTLPSCAPWLRPSDAPAALDPASEARLQPVHRNAPAKPATMKPKKAREAGEASEASRGGVEEGRGDERRSATARDPMSPTERSELRIEFA